MDVYRENYEMYDRKIIDEFEKEFLKTSINDLVEMQTPVYMDYLTIEDLEGIIAFYETPVGKKYAEQAPFITQDSMEIGGEWGRGIAEKLLN